VNLEKIRAAAERVARSEGLEVVDVEWKVGKQRFLRVYIDRLPQKMAAPDSLMSAEVAGAEILAGDPDPKVSHADCERVSQQLSVILDVEELIDGPAGYILEVSSPGLDRALKKPGDFERFTGRVCGRESADGVEGERAAGGGDTAGGDSEGEFSGGVLRAVDNRQFTVDRKS
jgi:ribosome maturation factor RimP